MLQLTARSKTVLKAVSGRDMILSYRCSQILNLEFNSCFAEVFFPLLQFASIFLPAVSTSILVLLHSHLDALTLTVTSFGSILPPVLVILVYPGGALLGTHSVSFLKSLTLTSNRWKREKASCRSLSVELGSLIIFGRAMVLKTLHLICIWTARSTLLSSKYTR